MLLNPNVFIDASIAFKKTLDSLRITAPVVIYPHLLTRDALTTKPNNRRSFIYAQCLLISKLLGWKIGFDIYDVSPDLLVYSKDDYGIHLKPERKKEFADILASTLKLHALDN